MIAIVRVGRVFGANTGNGVDKRLDLGIPRHTHTLLRLPRPVHGGHAPGILGTFVVHLHNTRTEKGL